MELLFEPAWLAGFVEIEAATRGIGDRLRSLAANREADGLDGFEAVADAADALGLVVALRQLVEEHIGAVPELEVRSVRVEDVHGGMPTWRLEDGSARLLLPTSGLDELRGIVERLATLLRDDPERVTAVVPVGLGGTGGCACGDELPEDAPPGPLFDRVS